MRLLRVVLEAIAASLLALILGGCATIAASKVGQQRETVTSYEAAFQSEDLVLFRYTTRVLGEPGSSQYSEKAETRWAIVSQNSLKWVPFTETEIFPIAKLQGERKRPAKIPDAAPQVNLYHYFGVPPRELMAAIKRDHSDPLSAHVASGLSVLLVRNDPNSVSGLAAARVSLSDVQEFDEDWAPYARAGLYPFSLVFDILTAPIQAIAILIVIVGQRH